MKVRAKKLGYYNLKRRREGAEFHIIDKSHFSNKWMYAVDQPEMNVEGDVDPAMLKKVNQSMTVEALHDYCKENGLTGYQQLKKKELVDAINGDQLSAAPVEADESDDVI